MATSGSCVRARAPSNTRRAHVTMPGGEEGQRSEARRMSDRPSRAGRQLRSREKAGVKWFKRTHCMLGRGVARTLPLRSLLSRLPGARTARTVRPSRRMSVGANAEPQPPAKMARLEETLRVKKNLPSTPSCPSAAATVPRATTSPPPTTAVRVPAASMPRRRTIPHPRTPDGPVAIADFQTSPTRSRPPRVKARHRRRQSSETLDHSLNPSLPHRSPQSFPRR